MSHLAHDLGNRLTGASDLIDIADYDSFFEVEALNYFVSQAESCHSMSDYDAMTYMTRTITECIGDENYSQQGVKKALEILEDVHREYNHALGLS